MTFITIIIDIISNINLVDDHFDDIVIMQIIKTPGRLQQLSYCFIILFCF